MYKYFILCYLVYLLDAFKTHQAYGPFSMVMTGAESCKGPKRKNCTEVDIKMKDGIVTYNVLVKENTAPTKGKVVGINNGKEVLTLQLKSFCQHKFLMPLAQKLYNATKDCMILKGIYNFTVNVQELAKKYHGDAFIYGDWVFKSVHFNDNCNFDCLITKFKVSPIKETKKTV